MRIAVVGKWGSGKTTTSALLASYLGSVRKKPLLIDADINVHLPALFMREEFPIEKYLSSPENMRKVKGYLIGNNHRIASLAAFRKTTPPTKESQLFVLSDAQNYLYQNFTQDLGTLFLMAVGTYTEDQIGASCYHNSLAILENLLSHMDDRGEVCIVDMVAWVDAFASSLHAQFDMLLLVLEPTRKGIEVRKQYAHLTQSAGVYDQLFVLGNKCFDQADLDFLRREIPEEKLIWELGMSQYLRSLERNWDQISFAGLESEYQPLFSHIFEKLQSLAQPLDTRLPKLYELHRKYVSQDFIIERFWDLKGQIDESFSFHG